MKVSRFLVPAAALSLIFASVSVPPAIAAEKATPKQADAVAKRLGDARSAGAYYDAGTGQSVVNVTDAAAAMTVREAGATPRLVGRSGAELNAVKAAIDRTRVVPGSAWGVDVRSNTVTISVGDSVKGAALATVQSIADRHGSAVRVTRTDGTLEQYLTGGDMIRKNYSDGSYTYCSVGFNVVYNNNTSKHAFLSAGHCGELGGQWTDRNRTPVANVAGYSFPGNDYAIYDYVSGYTHYPSAVGSQPISSTGTPSIGQTVNRRGATTGTRSGRVEAHNQTVRYVDGTVVSGLTRTTACAEGGDSGGSFYSGSTGYGMLSGGSGNCVVGGTTYYQPIGEALSAYGVRIG